MTGETSNSSNAFTTAKGLFRLLADFAKMRHRPILDYADYENKPLWLHELGSDPRRTTPLTSDQTSDSAEDAWIRIQRVKEPPCPDPGPVLREWIRDPFPYSDNLDDIPSLRDSIAVAPKNSETGHAPAAESLTYRYLSDHPEIARDYETYIDNHWLPWAEAYEQWSIHHELYGRLFRLEQQLKRQGERYEAIVALGILHWHRPEEKLIRRHVLTFPVSIELESSTGDLTVGPGAEGIASSFEEDFIPAEHRGTLDRELFTQDDKRQIDENPWDLSQIAALLRPLVQTLHSNGEFSERLTPQTGRAGVPTISLAPAVIVRPRMERGMLRTLIEIGNQLEDIESLPPNLGSVVGIPSDHWSDEAPDPGELRLAEGVRPEPLLPLPTNAEQERILERLQSRNGVLVQGPPGTGKTHTIANLMSHLLAHGKRVLVTAQTPRALRVLRDKLPKDLQPLCISHLGNDRESLRKLQDSVQGILYQLDHHDPALSTKDLSRVTSDLDGMARQLSRLEDERWQARSKEAESFTSLAGGYSGTPSRIAAKIRQGNSDHCWLQDASPGDTPPLDSETLLEIRAGILHFASIETNQIGQWWPDPSDLPTPAEFFQMLSRERSAAERATPPESPISISCNDGPTLQAALDAVTALEASLSTAAKRPVPWMRRAIHDVLADHETPWRQRQTQTSVILDGLEDTILSVQSIHLDYPKERSLSEVKASAVDLIEYLRAGGRTGLLGMLQRDYRRLRHLFKEVRVDGRPPTSLSELEKLQAVLDSMIKLERLSEVWPDAGEADTSDLLQRCGFYQEQLEALELCLEILPVLELTRQAVEAAGVAADPAWQQPEERESLRQGIQFRICDLELQAARRSINEISEALRQKPSSRVAHVVVQELASALANRSEQDYERAYRALNSISDLAQRYSELQDNIERARKQSPTLVNSLLESPEEDHWAERLSAYEAAWYWRNARDWLESYRRVRSLETIDAEIEKLHHRRKLLVEDLCRIKAWDAFARRLLPEHKQRLKAWSQAIRSLGKGTGKYAEKYRREAQTHLQACREAIPAWVMPLHRVYDSVSAAPNLFDLIVVDEASQCSLDALPLFYLGRKLVVVGDDEQISPSAVGLDKGQLSALVDRHIPDFPFKNVFDTDKSLFDIANIWFEEDIRLREHFRCVPEIIGFSNMLCYSGKPLVPLRQYPPGRLDPIKCVYVPEGYREGKNNFTRNPPEAEALVAAVVACCEDPNYENCTMGVISLLGDQQARHIQDLLLDQLGPEEMERRRLLCGNAYSFQGDERDVVFLSLVSAPTDKHGISVRNPALTSKSASQRFNVAASRAKDQMWLFHSMPIEDLGNPDCVRRKLVEYCSNPIVDPLKGQDVELQALELLALRSDRSREEPPYRFRSWFEADVFLDVARRGYKVESNVEFAGRELDLVIQGHKSRLAVECDGEAFHGPEQYENDLARQRQLERAGWRFWRVRESDYRFDGEDALEGLWRQLQQLDIWPVGKEPRPEPQREVADPSLSADELGDDQADSSASTPIRSVSSRIAAQPDNPRRREGNASHHIKADANPSASPLEEYVPWRAQGTVPDPRAAKLQSLAKNLVQIVEFEGPMLVHLAYRRFALACGIQRVRSSLQERLNRALRFSVQHGMLLAFDEFGADEPLQWVVCGKDSPRVRVRALGDRTFTQVPPSEVQALMALLYKQRQLQTDEDIFRAVCDCYGISRIRASTRRSLEEYLRALRKG